MSGNIAQHAENTNNRRLTALPKPRLAAIGTTVCEIMEGKR